MTSQEAIDITKGLLDKYGSDYIPDTGTPSILSYLNMGQLEVISDIVPDGLGGIINFDVNSNTFDNIRPLVYQVDITTGSQTISGDSVLVLRSTIETQLQSTSGDSGAKIYRLMNMGVYTSTSPYIYQPIHYTRSNNINSYITNYFKKPSSNNYSYTTESTRYRILPNPNNTIRLTIIKTPKIMTAGNSPDWDDRMMNKVILKTVKLAGVSIRDEEVIQDIRLSNLSSGE